MKKTIDKKKKYLIMTVEVIILTLVVQWSLTDGFTKTLDEALGLSDHSGFAFHLFENLNVERALISLLIITVFFITVYLFQKGKKHETRH